MSRPTKSLAQVQGIERRIMMDLISWKQGKIPYERLGLNVKENLNDIIELVAGTYFELGQRQMNIFDERRLLNSGQTKPINRAHRILGAIQPSLDWFNKCNCEHAAQELEAEFPKLFNSKK